MTEVRFSVHGQPKTAGSKAAFAFIGKDGKPHSRVTDDTGEAGKSWRSLVVGSARKAYVGPLLDGPLVLDVTFRFLRPGDHFGRRGGAPYLKPTAPHYHSVKPDATKLLRALEDALTGVVWRDDSRIVVQRVRKVYAETTGADVVISYADGCRPAPAGDLFATLRNENGASR